MKYYIYCGSTTVGQEYWLECDTEKNYTGEGISFSQSIYSEVIYEEKNITH